MHYEILIAMDQTESGACSWLVTVPAFPEVTTDGATQEEGFRHALMAIEEAIAARIADGEDIPAPSRKADTGNFVQVPALTYLKCALYMLARHEGISNADLARRLGWHREQVDRLFRIDHNSQLGQLEAAFKEIGHPLSFETSFPAAA